MMNQNFRKPVEVGDELDLTIESTGAKGDGIAKVDNFVIIVPGAKQGETVKVKITRVLKKMAFGEIAGSESAPAEESPKEESSEDEENSDSNDQNLEEENTQDEE